MHRSILSGLLTRVLSVALIAICFAQVDPQCTSHAQTSSPDEQRERITAERFLEVLIRRPSQGTALDRVFGYHIGKGDIGDVIARLSSKAEAATDDDESGRHWLLVGLLQLRRGQDAAAIEALVKAEQKLPENTLAASYHGHALLLVGKTDEAAAAMQRAIDLKPPKQDYLRIAGQLGRLYQRAGKVDEALLIWTKLEESFPGDDGVRQRIARSMLDEGDTQGALERFDALAKDARSSNDQIVFALRAADLRTQTGEKKQAIIDLESLLSKLRPGSYLHDEARRLIESAFLNSGDYAGLAEYYEKWIAGHPDDVGAVVRLARTLSVQGRGPEALLWFERAIGRAPGDDEPRIALINAYVAQERFSDAAKQYEALVEMQPNNPDHLVRWGQILLEDREQPKEARISAALKVWKRLAAARADDAVVQSQVADLMRGADLVEEALEGYRNAIKLAPEQPQYKEYLGEFLFRLDRKEEAMEVWETLAAGDLRSRSNLIRLAEVLHQFEQPEMALKTMGEACELDPTIEDRLRYAEWLRDAELFEQALQQISLAESATETFDDAEHVFAAEVKTYQASGQLKDRIQTAQAEAEKTGDDGGLWRRLAVLQGADGQRREAVESIEKALEISPNSIDALVIAARMYEDSGRLRLALEKRRQLAESDPKFRSGHLQKLASLHLQIGESDDAVAVGKELLAASAGTIDAYRFYADLCGKIGRIDERLDTLRRCARLNPRSNDAQRMLASQLADDFKTDQAIELYWKMLDGDDDIDERRGIVGTLADLYLRMNRLDQLITRLEIRGRESGDRRITIDLIATAHQQAGDLGLARQALETLLRESGRDTMLLERLVALAEQAGEYDQAVGLQRQLARLAPDRKNEARLASLLIDIGEMDEAQAMWMRLSETTADPAQLARNIDRLFAAGEVKTAIKLATNSLERNPDDWETRLRLMVLQADEGEWETASNTADALVSMKVKDTTLPLGGKAYKRTATTSAGQSYNNPPLRMMRLQGMYSLYQVVDERYGYQATSSLPKPIDFGHAKLMALYCQLMQMKLGDGEINEHLSELEQQATADTATADQAWKWYETLTLAAAVQQVAAVNFQNPTDWAPLWRLFELDRETATTLLAGMFANRSMYAQRANITLTKMPAEKLAWMKERAESADDDPFLTGIPGYPGSWTQYYGTELRIAGRDDDADEYLKRQIAETLEDRDSSTLLAALQQASVHVDDDALWPLIERALESDPAATQNAVMSSAYNLLALFTTKQRIDDELSKGAADPEYRNRVIQLLDQALQSEAEKPLKRRVIQLTGVGGPRSTHRLVGGNYQQISIEFPPKGLGPNDQFVQAQHSAWERMKGHTDEWISVLQGQAEDETADPKLRIWRNIAAASLMFWEKQTDKATKQLADATALASKEVPQLEPELRLMSADLLLRQNRKREALELIDALAVYDQRTMALREFAAARLAAAIGDRRRAQTAAKRLFGVRLNTDAQIELAKLMRKLEMRELASDLVRRMRTRGGSNTDQLQSLMTYFVAQGETDQAAAVAMELLRRSAPTRRQSSRYQTSNQVRRRNALQTLATTGRLTSLIDATAKRLENAPKSQRIRSELAEMYVAAGKKAKSLELLGATDLKDINSASALETTAEQFVAAGKMDEACDAYLKMLRRKQDSFSQKFYDIKRPFDAQQRLGDLADLIIEVGVQKFTDHRVSEICRDLIRNEKETGKARKLYFAMLERAPTAGNSMYSLSNIMGSARDILTDRESVERTATYLIKASVGGTTWKTLFNGYSTSSDGRHNNVTTYFVRHVTANDDNALLVETMLRAKLDEQPDWQEGKIWLGILLTSRKKFEEAKELIEPLLSPDMQPEPTHDILWLVGSLIDAHQPMHNLAERIYEHALENTTDPSTREFKYSLKGRVCNFMADIGNNDRAREMALEALEQAKTTPSRNSSNAEYEAYRKIESTMGMMDFLAKIEFPSDALRVAREFDKSLFVKAGRYERGRREQFDKKQIELLDKVREMGGLATVHSMINAKSDGPAAVDFGITPGNRPFTDHALSSLWMELVEEAGKDPTQTDPFKAFVDEMKTLAMQRPDDDSAAAAYAVAADVSGDIQPLGDLIAQWIDDLEGDSAVENPKLRNRLLMVSLLRLDRSDPGNDPTDDRKRVAGIKLESSAGMSAVDVTYFLAGLSKQTLAREDLETTKRLWKHVIALNADQWLLLDLSHAAIDAGMHDVSASAFAAAVAAPIGQATLSDAVEDSVGSLGQLLSSAKPRQSGSSNTQQDQLDPEEVKLARRVLELDEAWRKNKLFTKLVFDPLVAMTIRSGGRSLRPLCTPVEIKPTDRMVVDSVFNRLARRSHWSKRTDKLLALLSADNAGTHLLSALVLLRAERGAEARAHLETIDSTELKSLAKETVIQTVLLALTDSQCRLPAMKLGLALVDQNRPSERYAAIEPFDTLSLTLAKAALNNSMKQEFVSASINNYLELTAHDNDRYSGVSSRVTRRLTQLDKVAQMLLEKGQLDQAMTYLAMRQNGFDQGFDRSNDWLGSWAMESIESMPDRESAYTKLADWTFQGDGPLQTLRAMVRRQRLPDWIPESVGGSYPSFPPVADQSLPIATNYFLLASLARQSGKTDDLITRLKAARTKQRAGADTATAIVSAAMEQPIESELLATIEKQLSVIQPGESKPEASAPLAELQLASILAPDPAYSDFAKKVTQSLVGHTHSKSRGYLSPWVSRFGHLQGWADTSGSDTADRFAHWMPSTLARAKDYSEGETPPIWVIDGKNQIQHVCGFGQDYLWMRYPLEGNFTFELETTDGGWSEAELVVDGMRITALGNSESAYLKTQSGNDWIRYYSKATKKNQWNHCSVTLDDKFLSYRINDILVYREKRTEGTPWIGLHSEGNKKTAVRNIKITGEPTIPRQVNLIPEGNLRGWSGQYYGLNLPTAGVNITKREKEASAPRRYRGGPKPTQVKNLAWTVKEGELVSGEIVKRGPDGQSCIRYERPIGDGETLQYEFYYEPGKYEVHPTIGRVAYMLRPEGCHLHWMNAGSTSWKIPADYEVPLPGAEQDPLPLKTGQWNQVQLKRLGTNLQISLNGETVFDQEPQSRLGDMVFGLYHNGTKTSARIRNVTLTGPWPESLPENLLARE